MVQVVTELGCQYPKLVLVSAENKISKIFLREMRKQLYELVLGKVFGCGLLSCGTMKK